MIIKIVTFNLFRDRYFWEHRRQMIISELAALKPDVIAFQEVALQTNQSEHIAEALSQLNHRNYELRKVSKTGKYEGVEGLAVLTVFGVIKHDVKSLSFGDRVVQFIRLNVGGQEIVFINAHLHHKPQNDESIRIEQVLEVYGWINQMKSPMVLAGDFNAGPQTDTIKLIRQNFDSSTQDVEYTYPTPPFQNSEIMPQQVDYVFFDPKFFRVNTARIVFDQPHMTGIYASDHLGIYCELEVVGKTMASLSTA